jgi:chromate transporter
MNVAILRQMMLTFGTLSLMSIGGANATVPEIHRQVVDVLHWMDDATFANLIAIGQAAPGPNVIIVSMIGWHMAGLAGLLAASVAIVLPSSLVAVAVGRVTTRFAAIGWVGLTRQALAPIAVGFMLASGYVTTRAAYQGVLSLFIVAAAMAMIVSTRRSPLLAIAAGAIVGVCGHRLHVFG